MCSSARPSQVRRVGQRVGAGQVGARNLDLEELAGIELQPRPQCGVLGTLQHDAHGRLGKADDGQSWPFGGGRAIGLFALLAEHALVSRQSMAVSVSERDGHVGRLRRKGGSRRDVGPELANCPRRQ